LLRRLKVRDTKRVFFTDENFFYYLNPPVSNQNNRVWAGGKKADVKPTRLLAERENLVCAACDGLGWRVFWWQGTTSLC